MNGIKGAAEDADGIHAGRGVTGESDELLEEATFLMRVFK